AALGTKPFEGAAFRMYPNPSEGNGFFIDVPAGADQATVTIYNTIGQRVVATAAADSATTIKVQPQAVMAAGVYMVQVTSQGKSATKKLIIK
ncbi:MAG: T9SS type A sorting domain-containing protein, partial [Flavobacterium sp.]